MDDLLLIARMKANDPRVIKQEVFLCFNLSIPIISNGNEIMRINESTPVPLEKTAIINIENNEEILEISGATTVLKFFSEKIIVSPEMRIAGKCLITIKCNTNMIFSVECSPFKSIESIKSKLENLFFDRTQTNYQILKKINSYADEINAIGIDLGTSRCCAAVNRRNGIETVALDNTGDRQLPSFISFDEEKEKCGQIVINQLQTCPKSSVFDSKRIIGKTFKEVKINGNWPFEVINVGNEPRLRIQGPNNEIVQKHPEEVAAVLLKHIKKKVEEFQGKEMDEVVITVPAAFTPKQKLATHVAGMLAGWKKIHLLPEPVAASLAYFVSRPIPNKFTMLLFDFGGGTLDVCIFNIDNDTLQILSQKGDSNLGGRDIDNLLFDHFSSTLKDRYKIDVKSKDKLKFRLMQKCVEIKHTLSIQKDATLDINDFNTNIEDTLVISRLVLETMSAKLLDRVR